MPSFRRPSPALVVAFVALAVGLGGTATAASLISGRSIKRNSIPANRIVRNSLGGGRIAERLLGTVPRARVAERAGIALGAVNSQRVGNQFIQKIAWRVPRGTAEQLVADVEGLQVYASCSRRGAAGARAVTQVANTQAQLGATLAGTNRAVTVRNGDFDPGESVDLDRGAAFATGTFTWIRGDGIAATMPYSLSGGGVCRVVGTLTAG